MADDRIEISISADTKGFTKGLDSATTRLTTLNTKITSTSRNLNTLQTRLSGMGAAIASATGGFAQFTQSFGAINGSLNQMAMAHNNLAQSATQLGNRLNSVRPAYQSYSNAARSGSTGVSHFNETIKNLSFSLIALRTLTMVGDGIFKGVVGEAIKATAALEQTKAALMGISNGKTDAARNLQVGNDLNYIYDTAKKLPIPLKELQDTFIRFKSVGLDPRTAEGLYNMEGHFQGTATQIQHARLALTEMMETGKVQMRQLRMLSITGGDPQANQDVAKAAGFEGVNQLFAAMKKGQVDATKVIPKLMEDWNTRFKGEAIRMGSTWNGTLALMKNNWQAFLAESMQADTNQNGSNSLFGTIKKQANDLIAWLQSGAGKDFAAGMWQSMAKLVTAVVDVVKHLWDYRDVISIAAAATLNMVQGISTVLNFLSPFKRQIMDLIGLMVKLYEFKLIKAIFLDFGGAVGSILAPLAKLITIGKSITTFITEMGALRAVAATVTSVGEAGTVASLGFGALGVAFSEIIIPLTILGGALYYLWSTLRVGAGEHINVAVASKEHAAALISVTTFADKMTVATQNTTFATDEAKRASIEYVNQLNIEGKAILDNATKKAAAADAKLQAADRKLAAAKDTNEGKAYNLRLGRVVANGPTVASQAAYEAAQKEKDQALLDRNGAIDIKNIAFNANRSGVNYAKNAPDIDVSEHPKMGDMPGKPNTKLNNAIDSDRNRYADLMTTQDEDKFKLAHNGSADGFSAEETRSKYYEESLAKISAFFKGGDIDEGKAKMAAFFKGVSQENQRLEKELRVQNIFSTFDASIKEAQASAEEAFDAIFDGFKSMGDISKQKLASVTKSRAGDRRQVEATGNKKELSIFDEKTQTLANAETEEESSKRAQTMIAADREVAKSFKTTSEQEKEELDLKKKEIQDLIKYLAGLNQTGKYDKEIAGLEKYSKDLDQQQKIKSNPLATWGQQQADVQKNTTAALGNSLTSWFDGLAEGKNNFSQFASSIISDLSKVITKALIAKAVMGALGLNADGSTMTAEQKAAGGGIKGILGSGGILGSVAKGIGSLFGRSSDDDSNSNISLDNTSIMGSGVNMSGLSDFAGLDASGYSSMSSLAALPDLSSATSVGGFHSGGTIGQTAPFHRSVDPGIFSFAKRFHTGGFPGLKDGEVPIIAKKGEGVFTQEQMSALGSAGSASNSGGAPTVNISNQTSAPVDTNNVKTDWDGEKYVTNIILKAGQKPGPMRDLLRTR